VRARCSSGGVGFPAVRSVAHAQLNFIKLPTLLPVGPPPPASHRRPCRAAAPALIKRPPSLPLLACCSADTVHRLTSAVAICWLESQRRSASPCCQGEVLDPLLGGWYTNGHPQRLWVWKSVRTSEVSDNTTVQAWRDMHKCLLLTAAAANPFPNACRLRTAVMSVNSSPRAPAAAMDGLPDDVLVRCLSHLDQATR